MGKLQTFEITLDKNKVVYSPGESITGNVIIKLGQDLQCKEIKVNCNGFCGITSKVNDTAWTMEEQYFNSTISVADKGTLKQGEHTFPFKFLIPDTAPTSFEGNYGKILYRVRAFVDTPRFSKDYNTEKAFYLLRLFNLNEVPDIWGTCTSAVTQQFTYMLVKTGTVVLRAQTDMRGYTPGQVIQVTANIHNQSGRSTGVMAAGLVQRVTYEMKRPTHDLRTIAEVEGGVVKAGKEAEWKEQIIVPPLPQSSLSGCEIIKIEYYVKVSLKSPDVSLTLPIHIGNVSLDKKLRPSRKSSSAASSAPAAADTPASTSASAPNPDPNPNPNPASAAEPTLPPRPAPKPAPRPTPRARLSSPSAPPADYLPVVEGHNDGGYPNKRQSQLVSPHAFSYAPGLFFPQNHQPAPTAPSAPAGGATAPYPTDGAMAMPMPTATPLILPPDYGSSAYPQEAPPSYDDSFNT